MDTTTAWGKYAPPFSSWPLRFLIAIGLDRGGLRKIIIRSWLRHFGALIDIQVRGIKYRLNIQNNVTDRKILSSSKEYDGTEIKELKRACKDAVFVDIGANIGYYSLALASSGVKNIIAVEPNPPTLARLRYNIGINKFENQIAVFPIGIGNNGVFDLFSSGDLGSASLLADSSKTDRISIITRPLLDILAEQKVQNVGGIKIDVEGMEDRALLPFFEIAPKSLWPECIVIEHCNKADWETDVIAELCKSNYATIYQSRGNTILKKRRDEK